MVGDADALARLVDDLGLGSAPSTVALADPPRPLVDELVAAVEGGPDWLVLARAATDAVGDPTGWSSPDGTLVPTPADVDVVVHWAADPAVAGAHRARDLAGALLPRVAGGGAYVLVLPAEPTAHHVRLVQELAVASGSRPDAIDAVDIAGGTVVARRGSADVDPDADLDDLVGAKGTTSLDQLRWLP